MHGFSVIKNNLIFYMMYASRVSDVLRVSDSKSFRMGGTVPMFDVFFTFAKLVDTDENGTGGRRHLYF